MKIAIGGDFAPVLRSDSFDYKGVNVTGKIPEVDLFFLNLETPIVTENFESSEKKSGHFQSGPGISLELLKKLEVDALHLANNHIMDCGIAGLRQTISLLEDNNFAHFGAHYDQDKVSEPYVVNDGKMKVGIIALAEMSVYCDFIENVNSPRFYQLIAQVSSLAKEVDQLILSIHGGDEWSPWPSPEVQNLYRSLIDCGATVVVSHHSHIPKG